jgi:(5-formylfuran-3-yl)methyl phosphate synthase
MTGVLASVRTLDEALIAARAGADIIDLKSPERGSLGALPTADVREIVAGLNGSRPVSATVGDLPMDAPIVAGATAAMFETGVDYVKVGFFPTGDSSAVLKALESLSRDGCRIVAVLFGDCQPGPDWPARLTEAGFAGCMLDTLDKRRGALTDVCTSQFLEHFVAAVRQTPMLCGLAGSLGFGDIATLLALQPDYLGFRGALCAGHERTQALDEERVRRIADEVRRLDRHRAEDTGEWKHLSSVAPPSRYHKADCG